ncbi:hypothetical protein SRB5_70720 [Streptomyces sp. RB5]|uniref:NADAR domain-containing protein n=1 Tax=Streptomyces smaragdinus TaxID=2585196 RepID=A0A7K0CTS3_9ACTN|nr:NADAR family protein [Streptomyces smaragdinus]MQY16869.1 hypothetical protein [Streptomyces smaragdinus]
MDTSGDIPDGPRSVDDAIAAAQSATRPKYLFFWGHQPEKDGSVGKGCFSQWWPAPFTVDGVTYATAEHWMMAEKARLFGDADQERAAIAAGHPSEAKKAGRLVRGFDDATWTARRFEIVVEGSVHKFSQHPDLRAYLLGTRGRTLVEASPRDRIWGIGMGAANEDASHPAKWRGQNLLGFALMEARQRLARTLSD